MSQALRRLAPLATKGMVLGLDAMRTALHACGDPQLRIPCIHVAGTNGKGSVAALLDAALRAAGMRVGLYTSPHLHRFVERIQVDGRPLDEPTAAAFAEEIVTGIERTALPPLTFFEASTLLAWRAFERHGVELAVMEVGLGGRLDATTVCAPELTVITRIAFDHTDRLGATLDAIAREKAGILKPEVPCVLGPDLTPQGNPEARAAIEAIALRVGAAIVDTMPYTLTDTTITLLWRGAPLRLRPSLAGTWQAGNVATAARALELLSERHPSVTAESLCAGFSNTRWPARMERIGPVLFDVAHNLDGVRALVAALRGERVGALAFGASRDKDYVAMLDALATLLEPARHFFGAAPMARAVEPEALAALRGGVACASPRAALEAARAACPPGEITLVCGSIYFVAQARAALLGLEQDPPVGL